MPGRACSAHSTAVLRYLQQEVCRHTNVVYVALDNIASRNRLTAPFRRSRWEGTEKRQEHKSPFPH